MLMKITNFQPLKQSYLLLVFSLLLISSNCYSQLSTALKENHNIGKLKFTSPVRVIFKDSKDNYWFGSDKEGVGLYDGKSFRYFTVKDGLSDNQIRSIQEDSNGNIWLGTTNGVSSYSHESTHLGMINGVSSYDSKKIITHTSPSFIKAHESSQNAWTKSDTDLWFSAGNNAGVYRYDGKILSYLAYPKAKTINHDNVYHTTGFAKGQNRMLWMATYAGIFGYNDNYFTIINDESLKLTKETGKLHIRSILEDSKGNLWIGNNGIGVLLFNGDTTINFSEKMGLVSANSQRNGSSSPAGSLEHIFVITEDSHGNIWFGDRDTGTWKYDGEKIRNYSINDERPTTIYQDSNGDLLFGTAKGSIYNFKGGFFERKYW